MSLWSSEVQLAQEAQDLERQQAAAAVVALEAQLLELRGELSDMRGVLKAEISQHPVASVEAWFKGEEISAAQQARDESYRSRDRALGILWNLDALHHDDESRDHFCSCGKPTPRCREWKILANDQVASVRVGGKAGGSPPTPSAARTPGQPFRKPID